MKQHVVVVAVMYNSATLIPDFVKALPRGLAGVDWSLVLVDNDSHDDSVALARTAAPWATVLVTGRNGGYAAGLNAGVRSVGQYHAVLVVNPDVRLEEGCVAELLRTLDAPECGIAVPHLVDGEGALINSQRREPTLRRLLADLLIGAERAGRLGSIGEVVTDPERYHRPRESDWAEGSTQLVRADCWAACGGWDESFFMYSEETDFDLRAKSAGFATCYVPTAHAVHLQGGSVAEPGLWALVARNKVTFYRRRHGLVLGVAYWAIMVVREATRGVLGRPTNRAATRELIRMAMVRDAPGPHVVARY